MTERNFSVKVILKSNMRPSVFLEVFEDRMISSLNKSGLNGWPTRGWANEGEFRTESIVAVKEVSAEGSIVLARGQSRDKAIELVKNLRQVDIQSICEADILKVDIPIKRSESMERLEYVEKGEEAAALVATGGNEDFSLHQNPDNSISLPPPPDVTSIVQPSSVSSSESLCTVEAADNDEFPLHGITLRGYRNFIEACGGEEAVRGMTCTEVKDKFVIGKTAAERISYCSMIEEREKALPRSEATVDQATIFLSFAYISDFLAVFRCLQDHMRAKVEDFEHQYIWISFFSVNQHEAGVKKMDFWTGTFMTSIRVIGRVVMVALPYNKPATLTRAWCLWEVYSAVKTNSVFEVAMDKEEERAFLVDMYTKGTSFFELLENIDMRKSESFKPEDKVAIHEAVRQEIGFDEVNKLIYKPLRDWTVKCLDKLYMGIQARLSVMVEREDAAITTLVNEASTEELLGMMNSLGETYRGLGILDKALEMQESTLAMYRRILPEDHPSIVDSMTNVALTYSDFGMHDKALEMKESTLAMCRRILPEDHPSISDSMTNLALTFGDLGMYDKALEMQESALAMYRRILPEDHPSIATSMGNLALTHGNLGMHGKALEMQESTLAMRRRILPKDHPSIANSMSNVAATYYDLGMHDKALEMLESTLAMRRRILPEDHPDIATSLSNLAMIRRVLAASVDPAVEYASKLQELQSMGFSDEAANLQALAASRGNLEVAVERLLAPAPIASVISSIPEEYMDLRGNSISRKPKGLPSTYPAVEYASQLQELQTIGFSDEAINLQALVASGGDLNAALERLLGSL